MAVTRFVSKLGLGATAMLGLGMAVSGANAAAPNGRIYFGIAAGTAIVKHANPCPDIPCNTGDVCSCVTGSGSTTLRSLEVKNVTYPATFTVEVSADDSTAINNGSGGKCFGTTGAVVLTLKPGTITLPFTGLGCRIGTAATGPFGISAPIYISSGTGKYVNGQATGTFSATVNDASNTLLMNIQGYATGLK